MTSSKDKPQAATKKLPAKMRFNYIKSNQFRTIHYDGIHGGLTPQGKIQLAVFSERFPIPRETVHEIVGKGIGKEFLEERVARPGIVREIEANIVMDRKQAESLRGWLDDRLRDLDALDAADTNK